MDSIASRSVALFSIHPFYAELLLEGTKLVEFRRTRVPNDLKYVVIYATAPVQRIVGFFSVAKVVNSSPTMVWQRYAEVGGITESEFFKYYADRQTAIAIEVGRMNCLERPLLLSSLDEDLVPPQSFQYLNPSIITELQTAVRKAS